MPLKYRLEVISPIPPSVPEEPHTELPSTYSSTITKNILYNEVTIMNHPDETNI